MLFYFNNSTLIPTFVYYIVELFIKRLRKKECARKVGALFRRSRVARRRRRDSHLT